VLVQDVLVTDLQRPDLSLYALHHSSHEAFAGGLRSEAADLRERRGDVLDEDRVRRKVVEIELAARDVVRTCGRELGIGSTMSRRVVTAA